MACGCCNNANYNRQTCGRPGHKHVCGRKLAGLSCVNDNASRSTTSCSCCGQKGTNVTVCGSGHKCAEEEKGAVCVRQQARDAKAAQIQADIARRTVVDSDSDYEESDSGSEAESNSDNEDDVDEEADRVGRANVLRAGIVEDVTAALEAQTMLRLKATDCLDYDSYPLAKPWEEILVEALTHAAALRPQGPLYVGISKEPPRRLKEHVQFSSMIVVGKTIYPKLAARAEGYLINNMRTIEGGKLLNSKTTGGEGGDKYAPYTYVYLGYGTARSLRV
jgi:hypothetical protein